jgi:hypothetical protein
MAKPKNAEKYGVKSRLVLTAEADAIVKEFQDAYKQATDESITKNDAINQIILDWEAFEVIKKEETK